MRINIPSTKLLKTQSPVTEDTVIGIHDEFGNLQPAEWDEEQQTYVAAHITETGTSVEVLDDATPEEIEATVRAASGAA